MPQHPSTSVLLFEMWLTDPSRKNQVLEPWRTVDGMFFMAARESKSVNGPATVSQLASQPVRLP